MNRRDFFWSSAALLGCTSVAYCRDVFPDNNKRYPLRKTTGHDIAPQFGQRETRLLVDALALLYDRFLLCNDVNETRYPTIVASFKSDYPTPIMLPAGRRACLLMVRQINLMRLACIEGKFIEPFPRIHIEYASEANANWVARAPVGTMKLDDNSDSESDSSFDGTFRLAVNDWYVGNGGNGQQYGDPEYWAGTIAHELWHNLGHTHPSKRSDPDYFKHQMITQDNIVMTNNRARFGQEVSTPVLCRAWNR